MGVVSAQPHRRQWNWWTGTTASVRGVIRSRTRPSHRGQRRGLHHQPAGAGWDVGLDRLGVISSRCAGRMGHAVPNTIARNVRGTGHDGRPVGEAGPRGPEGKARPRRPAGVASPSASERRGVHRPERGSTCRCFPPTFRSPWCSRGGRASRCSSPASRRQRTRRRRCRRRGGSGSRGRARGRSL